MLRHIGLLTIGLAAIATVNAGQIQIGQVVSGLNDGLTTTYVTSGCMSSSGTNYDGCAGGGAGSFSLRAYNGNLMYSAMSGSSQPTLGLTPTNTAAYNSASTAAVASGSTVTDATNQITFAMIDSNNAAGSNFWAGLGTTQMVIPIGIFGVTNVWTMLNNYVGTNNSNTTDITFTFASDSKGTTGIDTLTLDLVNGVEVRESVDCSSGCAAYANATGLASGATNVTANYTAGSGPASVAVQAYAGTLLTASYSNNATSPYNATSGNLNLDDQDFSFGSSFANDWLVSVSVKDTSGSSTVSRTALSGITVVTGSESSTPEPSTVLLMLGGFSSIGFLRRLRRKA